MLKVARGPPYSTFFALHGVELLPFQTAATVPPSPPAETPVPAPAPETPPSGDANSSFVTFCNSVKWSYLSNSVEEAMAILCIIAGGLGVIALILVLMEVVFRICFKPKPIVPRLTTILAFIQFLALGALCVLMIGYHQVSYRSPAHVFALFVKQ